MNGSFCNLFALECGFSCFWRFSRFNSFLRLAVAFASIFKVLWRVNGFLFSSVARRPTVSYCTFFLNQFKSVLLVFGASRGSIPFGALYGLLFLLMVVCLLRRLRETKLIFLDPKKRKLCTRTTTQHVLLRKSSISKFLQIIKIVFVVHSKLRLYSANSCSQLTKRCCGPPTHRIA